jgi:hypothetical protein
VNEKTELAMFSKFTTFKREGQLKANTPSVGDGDAVEGCGDEVRRGGGETVRGCEDGVGRDGGDTVEGGDCEDEDIRSIIDNALLSDDKSLAKVYLDWIRLQVDRWQAPRKITTFVKCAGPYPVNLTLLAIRHPESMPIHEAMEPWENMIKDLCRNKHKELKAKEVICVLKDTIAQMGGRGREGVPHSIFCKFDPKCAKTGQYETTVHCEAVLAALSKFPSCTAGNSTLRECLQV